MGYMRHDAIVVTSWNKKHLRLAAAKAKELGLCVTNISKEVVNSYSSFVITPDGSKEGWGESDRAEAAREAWKDWADADYKKGVYVEWVHVRFAGDERKDTRIMAQAAKKE